MIIVILFYILMCKMIFKASIFLIKKQLSPGKLRESEILCEL
ncbi:hypothetical protein SAMN04488109_3772 [Chryseolinea serpens]|uniref:Uncharacterized protein n=1 Tax=Chryseolinea serpens TaxID=947013 RepID=A0A1M5S6G8_9BACT|nr:hypothetical protein SAMN04488109_3772 [Chryseolinea serpens]